MSIMLDILGSLAIRGVIVLIILNVTVSLNTVLYQKSAHAVVKQNLALSTDALASDLNKCTAFLVAGTDEVEFEFLADISTGDVDTLHYYLGPTYELSATDNPNDRKMYSVLNAGQPFDLASGMVTLQFEYLDIDGSPTSNLSLIKSVFVKLLMEHGNSFEGKYPSRQWEVHIFPANV